jgi:hypothetical protein
MVYYDIRHIRSAIGELSGKLTIAAMIDENGKKLPRFDEVVLMWHAQLDDEITQIININYPHIHAMVLEDLRQLIDTPPFKSVQKDIITDKLLEFNKSEDARLLETGKGFSLSADPSYLPQYFDKVEKALDNFKRVVNKHLKNLDSGNLPKYHQPPYLPAVSPVITDRSTQKKLRVKMTGQQLALLFRLLDEVGALEYEQKKDMHQFLFDNIEVSSKMSAFKYFTNKFSDIDMAAKKYWKDTLAEMQKKLHKL